MPSFIDKIMALASSPKGAKPKATKVDTWSDSTLTEQTYKGMNVYWAEYRRDSLVRQCLNLLA